MLHLRSSSAAIQLRTLLRWIPPRVRRYHVLAFCRHVQDDLDLSILALPEGFKVG
jgi:hypothetical protein